MIIEIIFKKLFRYHILTSDKQFLLVICFLKIMEGFFQSGVDIFDELQAFFVSKNLDCRQTMSLCNC